MARPFRDAARRLGIHVIGPASPSAGSRAELGRRLGDARGVDGDSSGATIRVRQVPGLEFVRAMRETLGPKVTLIGPKDGFWLPPDATPADRSRSGACTWSARISATPTPTPRAGRAFVEAFRASPPSAPTTCGRPTEPRPRTCCSPRSPDPTAHAHRWCGSSAPGSPGVLGNFTSHPRRPRSSLVIIDRTTVRPRHQARHDDPSAAKLRLTEGPRSAHATRRLRAHLSVTTRAHGNAARARP